MAALCCKGSVYLGTGCGYCERCAEEENEFRLAKAKVEQAAAQKDDVFSVGGPEIIVDGLTAIDANMGTIASVSISAGQIAAGSICASQVQGLPVKGYKKTQPQWAIDLVNENKVLEERVLRQIDRHVRNRDSREIDQANVQLARRHVEDAFMRLNRAIFQPERILGDLD